MYLQSSHIQANSYYWKAFKKIICGAWNAVDLLALGSEDKTMSVSNVDGDTLRVINLRAEPSDIQFSEMKLDERVSGENTVKSAYVNNLQNI